MLVVLPQYRTGLLCLVIDMLAFLPCPRRCYSRPDILHLYIIGCIDSTEPRRG